MKDVQDIDEDIVLGGLEGLGMTLEELYAREKSASAWYPKLAKYEKYFGKAPEGRKLAVRVFSEESQGLGAAIGSWSFSDGTTGWGTWYSQLDFLQDSESALKPTALSCFQWASAPQAISVVWSNLKSLKHGSSLKLIAYGTEETLKHPLVKFFELEASKLNVKFEKIEINTIYEKNKEKTENEEDISFHPLHSGLAC